MCQWKLTISCQHLLFNMFKFLTSGLHPFHSEPKCEDIGVYMQLCARLCCRTVVLFCRKKRQHFYVTRSLRPVFMKIVPETRLCLSL